jgi:hypothetical protein
MMLMHSQMPYLDQFITSFDLLGACTFRKQYIQSALRQW